jgi:DNA repair protein RadC
MRTLAQALLGIDPHSIPTDDLIAVLISDRVKEPHVAARQLLALVGGDLRRIGDLPMLEAVGASDPIVRARLIAVSEISRRTGLSNPIGQRVDSPRQAAAIFEAHTRHQRVELLMALYLDARGRVLGIRTLSTGTAGFTVISPPEILREALLLHARRFIVAHNHPSLDVTPSADDIRATRAMVQAAQAVGLTMDDHLVIGGTGQYVSLREQGHM